jgi:hypothetical protein
MAARYNLGVLKFLLDPLKLFRISGSDGVPNYRGIFQLRPD